MGYENFSYLIDKLIIPKNPIELGNSCKIKKLVKTVKTGVKVR